MIFSLLTTILTVLAVTADAPKLPPFSKWGTWMRTDRTGRVEKLSPTPETSPGVLKFVAAPDEEKPYAVTVLCRVPATARDRRQLTINYRTTHELSDRVLLQLYFQARDCTGKWISALPKAVPPVSCRPRAGDSGTLTAKIDLCKIPEASDIAFIIPSIAVGNLKTGSVEITNIKLEEWNPLESSPPNGATAAHRGAAATAGVSNFEMETDKLMQFQWPTPLAFHKFQTLVSHTPLGINELTLGPKNRAAGFQWPGGYTALAEYRDGVWRLQSGKTPESMASAGTLEGEILRLACYGTGVLATSGNRRLVIDGCQTNAGVTLLTAKDAPKPEIFSASLLAELLHWCYLDEAEKELRRAKGVFDRNQKMFAQTGYFSARRWTQRFALLEQLVKQQRDILNANSRGYVPALAALPAVRDRYNYLIASATARFHEKNDSYWGPVFRELWYTRMQGTPEVADSLEFAREVDRFFARAYYDQKQAFRRGKAFGKVLSAGWCDNLTQVPRRACGPENLSNVGELDLARGESEGIQLVVTTGGTPVADCQVRLTPDLPDGLTVKFYLVDYIRTVPPAAPLLPLSGRGEWVADVLRTMQPEQKFPVTAESNQSLWMTFAAAADTNPGTYEFTAMVTGAGGVQLELPLNVTVQQFQLGANRLSSMAGLRWSMLRSWYCDNRDDDPRFAEARRNFIATYLDYKMNPIDLYVSSPFPDDMSFALKHGLREVNVANMFDKFADPSPQVPDFVRLYGSADGRSYRLLKAQARLEKRGSGALADTDLIVVVDPNESEYRYYKVHYAEERDWFTSESGAFTLYPAEGGAIELRTADGHMFAPEALQFIQPDRKPEYADGFKKETLPASFTFDHLQTRKKILTYGSVVIAALPGKKVEAIRLVNRQIEKASAILNNKFNEYYASGGDKVIYYLYGYDETPGHAHGKVRAAAARIRAAFPQLRTVTTIARIAEPEIYRNLDIHAPGNGSSLFNIDSEQHRQSKTDFWIYVGGGSYYPFASFERVDQPLIQSRAFFFAPLAFDYIKGWLHWATNWWDLARKNDSDWSRWNPSHGEFSGMASIFYPGADLTCYPSMRAEAMRDGIEDVNYARLASELIGRKRFADIAEKHAAEAELVAIRNGFARGISVTCFDPEQLKILRKRLSTLLNHLWSLEE